MRRDVWMVIIGWRAKRQLVGRDQQRKAGDSWGTMESGAAQMALPVLGIAAAAAVTFYAVSFLEMREKSFKELDEREEKESSGGGGFRSSASSRERRARRKAEKEAKK